jgi:hypothetical protein
MTRHPLDAEMPPLTRTTFEVAAARNDATRDLAPAAVHLVPPLAAYDIHAKLMAAIREWDGYAKRGSITAESHSLGLREAYYIVFGENAP